MNAVKPGKIPLFAPFAEQYLAVQDHGRSDFKNKARTVRQHLIPFFGEIPLDQVSRMMIDQFKIKLRTPTGERAAPRRGKNAAPITSRRKGGAKSPKTINNLLTTLRSVLNLAYDYELIDRVPRIKKEPIKLQDPGFLDDAEVDAFLGAAPPRWRTFLLTAIRTGLRRGELLELRWSDLHLDARRPFIRVSRSLRRTDAGGWAVKETKGGKPRSVPLSEEALTALEEHRQDDAGPHDLVFTGERGGYINRNKLWRMVVKTAREGGLDKHVHPHLLRHTFASHCYQRGIPPQVVQQWLGHANITTTERYAHLAPDTGEDLIDLLDRPRTAARESVRISLTPQVTPTASENAERRLQACRRRSSNARGRIRKSRWASENNNNLGELLHNPS